MTSSRIQPDPIAETGGRGSALARRLVELIEAAGLEAPEVEYRLFPAGGRRHKYDLAWPVYRLLAEVDGGTFTGGAHTRGQRIDLDAEKQSLAAAAGWRTLRFTRHLISDGRAVALVAEALAWRPASG
jgi:hypothetical protein